MQDLHYRLEFTINPLYLHAYVEGKKDSKEISIAYWTEVIAEASKHKMTRVLVEENIEENISSSDTFELAKFLPTLVPKPMKIAFIDRHTDHQNLNHFGELVANNRGLRSKVFDSVSDAEAWLLAD